MILTTERLVLRPMDRGDAPMIFAIMRDPAAMAFWDRPPLTRLAVAEEIVREQIAAMAAGGPLYWTVLRDGDAIGSCDLSLVDRDAGSAETGFLFLSAAWGRGYASEAMAAIIAHAFGPLGLQRLTARIHAGNDRSQRLLTRLGFMLERALPAYTLPSGARADCTLFALARQTSRAKNGA